MSEQCRCGWNGEGEHLCHRCGKRAGTRRFYTPSPNYSLAGYQVKASVLETIGCDECWQSFMKQER